MHILSQVGASVQLQLSEHAMNEVSEQAIGDAGDDFRDGARGDGFRHKSFLKDPPTPR